MAVWACPSTDEGGVVTGHPAPSTVQPTSQAGPAPYVPTSPGAQPLCTPPPATTRGISILRRCTLWTHHRCSGPAGEPKRLGSTGAPGLGDMPAPWLCGAPLFFLGVDLPTPGSQRVGRRDAKTRKCTSLLAAGWGPWCLSCIYNPSCLLGKQISRLLNI